MIDLQKEQLIAIREVPRLLPRQANGKRVHLSAVYRWMQRGRRGVRLEYLKIGGRRFTSLEAVQRFAEACTRADQVQSPNQQCTTPTSKQRRREADKAAKRVKEILGRGSGSGRGSVC